MPPSLLSRTNPIRKIRVDARQQSRGDCEAVQAPAAQRTVLADPSRGVTDQASDARPPAGHCGVGGSRGRWTDDFGRRPNSSQPKAKATVDSISPTHRQHLTNSDDTRRTSAPGAMEIRRHIR